MKVTDVFSKNIKAYNRQINLIINQGGTSCFWGEQKIKTLGNNKKIADICKGDLVLSYNEKTGKDEYLPVSDVMKYKNAKKCISVKLKNGEVIIATEDHKFYYNGKWTQLKEILMKFGK